MAVKKKYAVRIAISFLGSVEAEDSEEAVEKFSERIGDNFFASIDEIEEEGIDVEEEKSAEEF